MTDQWASAPELHGELAHAEAVAARLVEVICEDAESEAWLEDSNQQLQGKITTLTQNGYALRRERDAARDRVAELELSCSIWAKQDAQWRDEIERLYEDRDAARAEVAALQVLAQDANEAFASGRREVLADLRAKVEGLRDREESELDGPWTVLREVLALLDEAQP